MMVKTVKLIALLVMGIFLLGSIPASAAAPGEEIPACSAQATGTIVSFDPETRTLVIDTGEGLCSVSLAPGDVFSNWPGLGGAFADLKAELIAKAIADAQACAVRVDNKWVVGDCSAEGAIKIQITGQNEDGTYNATVTVDGTEIQIVLGDGPMLHTLRAALEELEIDWPLDGQGRIDLTRLEEIIAYQEDGLGLGTLAKLYILAREQEKLCAALEVEDCAATVEELAAEIENGATLAELRAELGLPARGWQGWRRLILPAPEQAPEARPAGEGLPGDPIVPPPPSTDGNLPEEIAEKVQERLNEIQERVQQAIERRAERGRRP